MADYGVMSVIQQRCRIQHLRQDTFIYTAPEVLEEMEEMKSDVWSLGKCMTKDVKTRPCVRDLMNVRAGEGNG